MSLKKERSPRKPRTSRLYDIFIGSLITVAIKDLLGINSKDSKFANLMLSGVLLDECDVYIYLGDEGIHTAIKKDQIITVFIDAEEYTQADETIPPGTIRQ